MLNHNNVLDAIITFTELYPNFDMQSPFDQAALSKYIADYCSYETAHQHLLNVISKVSYGTNGMDPDLEGMRKAAEAIRYV